MPAWCAATSAGASTSSALTPGRSRRRPSWTDHYRRFWTDQLASLDAFVTGADGRDARMSDAFDLTVQREIAATAERLFDAWLDAASFSRWMRPSAISETRAENDPRVGGEFRIVMVRDGTDVVHRGTYREIDRPRRLVFTWSSPSTQLPRLGGDRHLRACLGRLDTRHGPPDQAPRRGSPEPITPQDGPRSWPGSLAFTMDRVAGPRRRTRRRSGPSSRDAWRRS